MNRDVWHGLFDTEAGLVVGVSSLSEKREINPRCKRSFQLETAGWRSCSYFSGLEVPGVVPFVVSAGLYTCLFASRRVSVRKLLHLPLKAVACDFFSLDPRPSGLYDAARSHTLPETVGQHRAHTARAVLASYRLQAPVDNPPGLVTFLGASFFFTVYVF
jgi:hypothetical protein